jgi:arsenate reductase (glutaredoxin)
MMAQQTRDLERLAVVRDLERLAVVSTAQTARRRRNMIGAMATLTIYEKPTCTTCRKLRALLAEHGVEYESIDYHASGLRADELRGLLGKIGCGPREVLRPREPLVEELGVNEAEVSDEELIALMVANPVLLQRPIVVRGNRAVLARPIARVLELL